LIEFSKTKAVLRKNPVYWNLNYPRLESLEFHLGVNPTEILGGLRSGKYDIAQDLPPGDIDEVLRDRQLQAGIVESAKRNTYFVFFNQNSFLTQMAPLRGAMFGIVRTHDLVRQTLGRFARPAVSMIPPGMLG